jgi:hypothetical protein
MIGTRRFVFTYHDTYSIICSFLTMNLNTKNYKIYEVRIQLRKSNILSIILLHVLVLKAGHPCNRRACIWRIADIKYEISRSVAFILAERKTCLAVSHNPRTKKENLSSYGF